MVVIIHPELLPGELLLGNYWNSNAVIWETKRQGVIAYNDRGRVIRGVYPIFIQASEVQRVLSTTRSRLGKEVLSGLLKRPRCRTEVIKICKE